MQDACSDCGNNKRWAGDVELARKSRATQRSSTSAAV